MDLVQLRLLSLGGILAVGVVAVGGVLLVSWVAAALVRIGRGWRGWLSRVRPSAAPPPAPAPPAGGLGLDPSVHALLARQAWWRLRC